MTTASPWSRNIDRNSCAAPSPSPASIRRLTAASPLRCRVSDPGTCAKKFPGTIPVMVRSTEVSRGAAAMASTALTNAAFAGAKASASLVRATSRAASRNAAAVSGVARSVARRAAIA